MGGEFGRTNYTQGNILDPGYGRDHHPRCFTIFMAGAGIKKELLTEQPTNLVII